MYRRIINDIEELQQIEKKMLEEFINFCNKYDIKYFLSYGSALGAYRHKGFIPWDDDIDICMLREDYDKLIDIVSSGVNLLKPYKIVIPGSERFPYPFIKVFNLDTELLEPGISKKYQSSIWIDVFPLDRISEKQEVNKKIISKITIYNNLLHNCSLDFRKYYSFKKNTRILLSKILICIFSVERISLKINLIGKKFNDFNIKSKQISLIVWYDTPDKELNINDIYPTIDGKFHNLNVNLPKNIVGYLSINYGSDFMTLPSINDRITHEFEAYIVGDVN